jgi:hypothetical protein
MATAAAARKQPKFFAKPMVNGVEVFGSTGDTPRGWETVLTAVKGSKIVGVYDSSTWTVKVEGHVLRPQEGITELDAWLNALRSL